MTANTERRGRTGRHLDPEFRRERAVKGGAAADSLDSRIAAIVRRADSLTDEHIAQLRALLPPVELTPEQVAGLRALLPPVLPPVR